MSDSSTPIPPRTRGVIETSEPSSSLARGVFKPAAAFIHAEGASGRLLIIAATIALVLANSPVAAGYEHVWETELGLQLGGHEFTHPLREWVNSGLMTLFFFLVTLEVKHELLTGQLSSRERAALPLAAAVGGMVVPAAIYIAINVTHGDVRGWGIPIATDIAFAIAVATLLRGRLGSALLAFLLAFAIVDDVGAITVIAIFYSDQIVIEALLVAGGLLVSIVALQRLGLTSMTAYFAIGVLVWLAVAQSGIHATIAGVALALLTPSRPRMDPSRFDETIDGQVARFRLARSNGDDQQIEASLGRMEASVQQTESPLDRLERRVHPWSGYVVLPLFALANAGIVLSADAVRSAGTSPVAFGILAGLIVGKPVGILIGSWLVVRLGVSQLPDGVGWQAITAVALLAGIGFTVSVFITELAFAKAETIELAKLAVLAASVVSALAALLIIRRLPKQEEASSGQ